MNLLPLATFTIFLTAGIYDFYAVYINPNGTKLWRGKRNCDRSISKFLQGWPSRWPFGLIVLGAIMGHVWWFMPPDCPPCPEDPTPAVEELTPEPMTEPLPILPRGNPLVAPLPPIKLPPPRLPARPY